MSKASLTLANHFRKSGWLPLSPEVLKDWLDGALSEATKHTDSLLPVIEEFKTFIENNGEMYMGFHRMFEGETDSPVSDTCFICGI